MLYEDGINNVLSYHACYYLLSDINECKSSPCENGATCNDDVNAYNCSCVDGYNGTHCETGISSYHYDIPILSAQT